MFVVTGVFNSIKLQRSVMNAEFGSYVPQRCSAAQDDMPLLWSFPIGSGPVAIYMALLTELSAAPPLRHVNVPCNVPRERAHARAPERDCVAAPLNGRIPVRQPLAPLRPRTLHLARLCVGAVGSCGCAHVSSSSSARSAMNERFGSCVSQHCSANSMSLLWSFPTRSRRAAIHMALLTELSARFGASHPSLPIILA